MYSRRILPNSGVAPFLNPQMAQMAQMMPAQMMPQQQQQQSKGLLDGLGGMGGLGLMSMLNQQKTPGSDMSGVMNAAGVPTLDPMAQASMLKEAQGLGLAMDPMANANMIKEAQGLGIPLPPMMQGTAGSGADPGFMAWLSKMFGGG